MEISTSFQSEFKSPTFTPADISELRGRLGQSRADFARAMNCLLEDVYAWEAGRVQPSTSQRSYMARLEQHADEYSDKVALRPSLENACRDRGVDQIHCSEITLKEF